MACDNIGSGLQALGAAIELWALLGIIWRPWLRPKLVKVWGRVKTKARELWPFSRPRRIEVKVSDAGVTADGALTAHGFKRGPDDEPTASAEERIALLVARVGNLEERLEGTEERLAKELSEKWNAVLGELRTGHEELSNKLAEVESSSANIRIKDAVRFAVGVSVALFGSALTTFC
jgi:hypothetical protein